MRIDLHSHSTASDGTERPADVVRRARAAGVDVLALTDHDTLAGQAEAVSTMPEGLTLVPGAELSCAVDGSSLHLLAYLFDAEEPELAAERERLRHDRERRARAMVSRLVELGAPVSWERVLRLADGGVVGRPHVAQAMAEAGVVPDPASAFTPEWIAAGGRAYVRRYALDPVHAIALVRAAGGVTVLAHPYSGKRGQARDDETIARLVDAGLHGIEVDHPEHDADARSRLRGLAGELGLLVTGSSDDHGEPTGHRLGCETTAGETYESLVAVATGASPVRR